MPAMSQASSSLKPCARSASKSASPTRRRVVADLHREGEHRLLPLADVGLAVVHRHLVGDQRLLLVDAQQRAVGDDAVEALVGAAGGDDDHLLLALGEARVAQQQRVVVGEEGAELGRPMREGEEHVRHEAGLLLHRQDLRADVVGQVGQRRHGIAAHGWRLAHASAPELQGVEAGVEAARGEQLGVRCPARRCARPRGRRSGSARSMVERRWAMTRLVRPRISVSSACCTSRSDSLSSAEVASSRIRIGASGRSPGRSPGAGAARPRARWRCGRRRCRCRAAAPSAKSSRLAARSASRTRSRSMLRAERDVGGDAVVEERRRPG